MVVKLGGEGGKLIVIHHHGKALLAVLPDERLDNGEGLTRTRSTHNPCATESGTWVLFNVLIIS